MIYYHRVKKIRHGVRKQMEYEHPFGRRKIQINNIRDLKNILYGFCHFCGKGEIERFHCSGHDSLICENMKQKIVAENTHLLERSGER